MKRKHMPGCGCCTPGNDCIDCDNIGSGIKFTATSDCGVCEATLNFKRYTVATYSYNGTTDEITLTYTISDFDDLGAINFTPGNSVVIDGVSYVIVSHADPTLVLSSATDPGSLVGFEVIGSPDHRNLRRINCEASVRMFLGRIESDPIIISQEKTLGTPVNDGYVCSNFWRQDMECYEGTLPVACSPFSQPPPSASTLTRYSKAWITHRFTVVTMTWAEIEIDGTDIHVEIKVDRYIFETIELCFDTWDCTITASRACVIVPCPPDDVYDPATWFAAQVHDQTTYDWSLTKTCTAPEAEHETQPFVDDDYLGCEIPDNIIEGDDDYGSATPLLVVPPTLLRCGLYGKSVFQEGKITTELFLGSGTTLVRSKTHAATWCESRTQTIALDEDDNDAEPGDLDIFIDNSQDLVCVESDREACAGSVVPLWTHTGTLSTSGIGCHCDAFSDGVQDGYVTFLRYFLSPTPIVSAPTTSVEWCNVSEVVVEIVDLEI